MTAPTAAAPVAEIAPAENEPAAPAEPAPGTEAETAALEPGPATDQPTETQPPTANPAQGVDARPARHLPRSGADYLAGLLDDRQVFLEGQRVDEITAHPGFRNAARSIARLYDALRADAANGVGELSAPTQPGVLEPDRTGCTHRFFRVAADRADLLASQRAIAGWARLTFGWMGRTPDYKASLTTTLGANAAFFGRFADNARRWHARAQRELPFISHALANPPVDKHRDAEDLAEVCVRVEHQTGDGLIVSGAKVVATSAAITDWCFVGHTPGTVTDDPAMACMFFVPIAAPGVRLICRPSYELAAHRHGGPFDYPLASRFDENDAILTLDRVTIPWENVIAHDDPDVVKRFFPASGFLNNFLFHGCTRLAVKLDFLAGLLAKALRATGGIGQRGKRALLGEVVAMSHTFWSLSSAMAANPESWPLAGPSGAPDSLGDAGPVLPDRRAALAYCVLAPDVYPRVREIIHRVIASGLIYLPSSAADLDNAHVAPLLARYVRGSDGVGHRDRIKIMKLLWDAVGSEFAGRHELYERNYAGGWECIRLMVAGDAEHRPTGPGTLREMEALADRCMAEYDERGWIGDTWLGPAAPHAEAA